jgi:hypothetical protein
MRRDGDRLVEHLSSARREVLICAPFIKSGVIAKLLSAIADGVEVRVITRWLPREVAAGVSDLEVFDVVAGHRSASLALLDRLHAKLYLADEVALIGSANLTGAALGWCEAANLELLTDTTLDNEDVKQCLSHLGEARPATIGEQQKVRAESLQFPKLELVRDARDEASTGMWLPQCAAPGRLYQAYVPTSRDRLSVSVLESALADLEALGIAPGLSEQEFTAAVAKAFSAMPAVKRLLGAAEDDLDDVRGIQLIGEMPVGRGLTPEQQWLIVREWMTTFLADRYEIAPASFIIRRRPGRRT